MIAFSKQSRPLLLILGISLAVTLAYAFIFHIRPAVDAKAYHVTAQNILAGHGFVEDPTVPIGRDSASIRVGPLYQYALAGVYALFGVHPEAVWVLQAILHVLTAYIVYRITRLVFKTHAERKRMALLAAGILAFYPDLIEIAAMLMTETLYLFLWTLFIWLFVSCIDRFTGIASKGNGWWSMILLGIVSGLAVLARPPVLFVLPLVFLFLWSKKQFALSLVFFAMLALVLAPWTIRNYDTFHRIMPFGGAGNYNFWIGNHPGATGEQETGPEIAQYLVDHGAIALYDASMPNFVAFVRAEPVAFTRLTLLRINRYYSILRPMGFWFYDTGWSQLAFILSSAGASVFLFVFGLFGILRLVHSKVPSVRYLLRMIALTPLILFVTVVETRYRFQIYPLLAVCAGYGVVALTGEKRWWKTRTFLIAVAVIGVNALIDGALAFDKVAAKLGLFF